MLDDGVALEHLAWPNLRARRSANSFHIRFHPLQGCIQTDRQIGRETRRQIDRQTDRQTDRQIDRQTDRQRDKEIDRQTDR